ncbi:MAG: hypothetical protein Q4C96_04430 [Planctomycetia bacterium]|nr:hypothetical protein [Planctomycetia bacterium]
MNLKEEKMRKSPNISCRRGVLAFEWILITVILVIGVIGGLAFVRNGGLLEITDTAKAIHEIEVDFVK